jgi:hypothetical protein
VVFDVDVIAMILSGPRLLTADHQDHPQLHTPCSSPTSHERMGLVSVVGSGG